LFHPEDKAVFVCLLDIADLLDYRFEGSPHVLVAQFLNAEAKVNRMQILLAFVHLRDYPLGEIFVIPGCSDRFVMRR